MAVTGYVLLIIVFGELRFSFIAKNLNYKIGSPGFLHTRIREIDSLHNIDVLFIGSSATYRGFDPRIFKNSGYNSFNLGSSAQTPMQTELLLRRYLDKINPRLIVYEVSPESLENDGVESALDLIANDRIDKDAVKSSLVLNNLKVINSIIYGAYRNLFNRDKNFKEHTSILDDKYISGGYVEKSMSPYTPARFKIEQNFIFKPIQYQVNAYDNIIQIAKNKKIPLVILRAPGSESENKKYLNNNTVDSFFAAKTVSINFNYKIHLSDSLHFYDNVHLNQNGVKIFNEAVINEILKPYFKR